jgi:hypothetical protein
VAARGGLTETDLGVEACDPAPVKRLSGYRIPSDHRVLAEPILGGLHHEYRLERIAA